MKKTFLILFVLVVFTSLVGLCLWQLKRLEWKENMLQTMSDRMNEPNVNVSEINLSHEGHQFRNVDLFGIFKNSKKAFLYSINPENKKESGYFVLDVLSLKNGKNVLINRGYVSEKKVPDNYSPLFIDGQLRKFENQRFFTPDNDLKNNLWFYFNKQDLENFFSVKLENYYVISRSEIDSKKQSLFKITHPLNFKIRNDHLSYAVTWASFAFLFLIVVILKIRQHHKQKNH